jgi:hypothetical protein
MVEKFESKIPHENLSDEADNRNKELMLKRANLIFIGGIKEILRNNKNISLKALTGKDLMESLFPNNATFREDKDLLLKAEEYLAEVKSKPGAYGVCIEEDRDKNEKVSDKLVIDGKIRRYAWGAEQRLGAKKDD